MHTVFVKAADINILIDVDKIERLMYSENTIFAFNILEEKCPIYKGKTVNEQKAVADVVSFIHSAKKFSEIHGEAVILDFSKDLDDPTVIRPMPKDVNRFNRIFP